MATIDERVVSMAFENSKFEAGVAQTLNSLNKLSNSLAQVGNVTGFADIDKAANKVTLDGPSTALDRLKAKLGLIGVGAGDGFNEIDRAANRVTLGGLNSSLDSVTAKFSVLAGAAAVALGNIATKAAAAGANVVKSLTIAPISQGFEEYKTNLSSIQTILANTASSGGNLKTVNAALLELNKYSDQTIYNFSEMAKNIGTFTAAGVKLDTATQSIKGIANLAALSGSNSQQASTAMYQLSQAIAAGKVNLQDWNSVVNAGMGGAVFQKALFDTGKAMGTITNSPVGQTFEEWKKAGNSFRQSLSATQKTATDTTSALTKAQTEGAKSVKAAQESSAEAVANAAQRVKDAQESAAEAITSAAERVRDAQASAADSAKAAAERVSEAQKGVADAAKQSAADLKEAQAEQRESFRQSAEDVKVALDTVREARKRLVEAMKPPSADELQAAADRLKTAQLDQADLSTAITDAQIEQRRASEDLAAAEERLRKAQIAGSTPEEIQAATRAVEDARRRAADSADAVERAILKQNSATRALNEAQKDLNETQKKGSNGDKRVIEARDALTDATKRYQEAQKKAAKDAAAAEQRVTDVRLAGIQLQKDAAKSLADAEKEQAQTLIDNRNSIAKAEKDQAKTIIDSRQSVADAEKDQAKVITESRQRVVDAEEAAAERIKQARNAISGGQNNQPPSWLTSDVLTNTLKQFTGDLSAAELKAQGFNDAQIKAIMATAATARASATEVKNISQLMDVAKEAVGSGWAQTFQLIFGDFKESKELFTGASQALGGFIERSAEARNEVLKDWKELGGRTVLIEGIVNIFKALESVVKPIREAFRDIFPAKTGQDLYELTVQFRDFTEQLKIAPETAENLKRTFRGVFAVLHIGVEIVKGLAGVLFDLLGVVGDGSGGFLNFTGSIGDFLVAVDIALTKGGALEDFFDGLAAVLKVPMLLLTGISSAIISLFGGGEEEAADKFGKSMSDLEGELGPLAKVVDFLSEAWDRLVGVLQRVKVAVDPFLSDVTEQVRNFADTVKNALDNADWDSVFAGVQTGIIGALFLTIKKALGGGIGDIGGGFLENLNELFGGLTGNLQAMQKNIQAGTLLKIAAAIAVLAAGVFVLAQIDAKALTKAMSAVATGLSLLVGALALLGKFAGGPLMISVMPLISAAMIGLAIAVTILAGAVALFSRLSWDELIRGLAGVGGALVGIAAGTRLMGPGLAAAALGLIPIAIAMNLLAVAVAQFGKLKWEEIGKGLAAMAGALIVIGGAMALLAPIAPMILLLGPGLIGAAFGVTMMAGAVKAFASMDLKTLATGILGAAAAILALGLAVSLIPPTVILSAAGLVVVAIALTGIAGAIATLGNLKVETIVKGIAALGSVLLILAVGLTAMAGTLPGSVALMATAVALAVLGPALAFLGTLKWGTIIKGLAAIAAILGTLAVVGLAVATPLTLLGIALLPLALVFGVTAGAIFLFAKALSVLGTEGTKGVGVMVAALTGFIAILPKIIIDFIKGLVQIAGALAKVAPQVVDALIKILDSLIQVVIESAPRLAIAIGVLITSFLQVLVDNTPAITQAGFKLMLDFLTGVDQNIEQVTTRAVSIITKFLTTLGEHADQLVNAGANVLVQMLTGIGNKLPAIVTAGSTVILKFLEAVVGRIPEVISAVGGMMIRFVGAITGRFVQLFQLGIQAIGKILSGLATAMPEMISEAANIAARFIRGISRGLVGLVDTAFKAMINFLNGFADAIRTNGPQLRAAGWNVANALIEGLIAGFKDLGDRAVKAIEELIKELPKKAQKILGIDSPSKVFTTIGQQTMAGLTLGLAQGGVASEAEMDKAGNRLISAAQRTLGSVPALLDGIMDMDPVITPVLDLTNVQKEAERMDAIVSPTVAAVASMNQAAAISQEKTSSDLAAAETAVVPVTQVSFEQNNYSPEALSDVEIYRKTNNQLSQVKSALGIAS